MSGSSSEHDFKEIPSDQRMDIPVAKFDEVTGKKTTPPSTTDIADLSYKQWDVINLTDETSESENNEKMRYDYEGVRDSLADMITNQGVSIADLSESHQVLVVFLRHFGCIFCKEAVRDLIEIAQELEKLRVKLCFVHQEPDEVGDNFFRRYAGDAFAEQVYRVSDQSKGFYDQFGLGKAKRKEAWTGKVFRRGIYLGMIRGHSNNTKAKHGAEASRIGGVFLVDRSRIVHDFRHSTIADRPDYLSVVIDPLLRGFGGESGVCTLFSKNLTSNIASTSSKLASTSSSKVVSSSKDSSKNSSKVVSSSKNSSKDLIKKSREKSSNRTLVSSRTLASNSTSVMNEVFVAPSSSNEVLLDRPSPSSSSSSEIDVGTLGTGTIAITPDVPISSGDDVSPPSPITTYADSTTIDSTAMPESTVLSTHFVSLDFSQQNIEDANIDSAQIINEPPMPQRKLSASQRFRKILVHSGSKMKSWFNISALWSSSDHDVLKQFVENDGTDLAQCLLNTKARRAFKLYAAKEFAVENVLCWEAMAGYKANKPKHFSKKIMVFTNILMPQFFTATSPNFINISHGLYQRWLSMDEQIRKTAVQDQPECVEKMDELVTFTMKQLQNTNLLDTFKRFQKTDPPALRGLPSFGEKPKLGRQR